MVTYFSIQLLCESRIHELLRSWKKYRKNLEDRESILIYKHINKVIVTSVDFTDDKNSDINLK